MTGPCVICGRACIPMADHEPIVVCHRCEAAVDALESRAAVADALFFAGIAGDALSRRTPPPAPMTLDQLLRRLAERRTKRRELISRTLKAAAA